MIENCQRNNEHNHHHANETHATIQPSPPPRVLITDVVFNVHLLLQQRLDIWRRDPTDLLHVEVWFARERQQRRCHEPGERDHEAQDEAQDLGVSPVKERFAIFVHGRRVPATAARVAAGPVVLVQMGRPFAAAWEDAVGCVWGRRIEFVLRAGQGGLFGASPVCARVCWV